MKIFLELFLGILVWIVMSTGNKLIRAAAHRSSRVERIKPYLPGFAFAVWLLYALWLLQRRFASTSLYPIILFSLLALLAMLFIWFVLRDIIAGIVVSIRKQFHVNHRIRLNDLSGKIIERRMTHVTIRTDNGDIARIPYSRLSGEVVPERSEETASDYYRIHLCIPKNDTPEKLQTILTREVLSIPWASSGTAPVVQLKEQTDKACNFEVLIRSLNSRHAARVESILRDIYRDQE
ncbi:MAG: mechanosensitive ion channel family protein [Acidobacteria bacterium]|nr:mechanosensitive ion channel family protein [Acidobacteriota bacterium]